MRPRLPAHARTRSGHLVWRGRRECGGADRSAHPSGHFIAGRRLGRARYHGNVENGIRDDDSSDASDDAESDDRAAGDAADDGHTPPTMTASSRG
eukprot:3374423-Pyramimonas_sp.AAC.1